MNSAKRRGFFFASVLLTAFCLSSCGEQGASFHFASYKSAEATPYEIHYDDDYFSLPASSYQPCLASASICLALAGFSSTMGSDYENSANNAKEFFTNLGFDTFYANAEGLAKPTTMSFGVYIAKKSLGDCTLLGVTVRGAGYQSEWASNVTLGEDGAFAAGFYEASELYLETLKDYIKTNQVSGKIKLWTAGYSRGGAGVNLASGQIDQGLLDGEKILGDSLEYGKDDIYAYCFEAPAGKTYHAEDNLIVEKGSNFNNIHCLVNLNDPVPFVAPKEFGFVRYGVDYYLPDLLTSLDYKEQLKRVAERYNTLPNTATIGEYVGNSFSYNSLFASATRQNWSQALFLQEFIHELAAAIGGRKEYAESLQNDLAELFAMIYRNGMPKDSLIDLAIAAGKNILLLDSEGILMVDLQHNRGRFWQDLRPILNKAINNMQTNLIDVDQFVLLLKRFAGTLAQMAASPAGLACFPSFISLTNIKAIGSAHIPELALCHLSEMDGNYGGEEAIPTTSYYRLEIVSASDYSLKDGWNTLVHKNGDELSSELAAEFGYSSDSIYLPFGESYSLEGENLVCALYERSGKYEEERLLNAQESKQIIAGDIVW